VKGWSLACVVDKKEVKGWRQCFICDEDQCLAEKNETYSLEPSGQLKEDAGGAET